MTELPQWANSVKILMWIENVTIVIGKKEKKELGPVLNLPFFLNYK